MARSVAVHLAGLELAQPGLDVAAQRHDPQVRPHGARTWAARRSEAVPTTAPARQLGNAARPRAISASRGSARGSTAAITSPSGRTVGMSFIEWTAMSIRPASRPASISLVNSPLPPISASVRSWMRSPGC